MTYNQNSQTAAFGSEIFASNAIVLANLSGYTITDVEVANNLDYKGKPYAGLWVTANGVKIGLFRWDMTNIMVTTYPEKNKPVFVEMTDILHTTAKANFGKKEEDWLKAIASAIKGKKVGVYNYPAQTQKGASYQAAIFIVTE